MHFFFVDGVLPATIFCKVSDFSEPIEPCWESNRTCQPDPRRGVKHPIPRVGKGVPGFGLERAPSREGVSALDHQATPAATTMHYFCHNSSACFKLSSMLIYENEIMGPSIDYAWLSRLQWIIKAFCAKNCLIDDWKVDDTVLILLFIAV